MKPERLSRWIIIFCGLLFGCLPLQADETFFFRAGPEVYRMRRWRDGGTEQTGRIDGFRVELERIKGNSWYAGLDALFSSGQLNGKSASGRQLVSEIEDTIFEGRLGYTFQNFCSCTRPFITLFGGYGRFRETNEFKIPSPIPFTFTDTFNYICTGFLSGFYFNSFFSMGLNFEVRFMLNGRSKVSNDPVFDQVSLVMNNETHYRIEVPLICVPCGPCGCLEALLIPFYEFRHFGGRQGYPFDFIDTKFSLLGAELAVGYRF